MTRNDFVIIDFEGEPRTQPRAAARQAFAAARCRRHAALLQLCRSTAPCAAWRTMKRMRAKLAPLARAWAAEVRARVPLGLRCADARDSPLYGPLQPGRGLLGLFELEKALYELALRNRQPARLGRHSVAGHPGCGAPAPHDSEAFMQTHRLSAGYRSRVPAPDRRAAAATGAGAARGRGRLAVRQGGALRGRKGAARDQFQRADRARRAPINFLQQGGMRGDTTTLFGLFAYWLVILAALDHRLQRPGPHVHHRSAAARRAVRAQSCSCRC